MYTSYLMSATALEALSVGLLPDSEMQRPNSGLALDVVSGIGSVLTALEVLAVPESQFPPIPFEMVVAKKDPTLKTVKKPTTHFPTPKQGGGVEMDDDILDSIVID